eukprot:TRINITY_DN13772_c0_g1_i1.p1 TRINITY_DN13772_c0_g1~~TRINITY_DN13772_c0_g1_i1.p1  ORF type:complete len:113 (+),score=20.55 TRINITY_DN13772_c0_g1_i1:36-341(+)
MTDYADQIVLRQERDMEIGSDKYIFYQSFQIGSLETILWKHLKEKQVSYGINLYRNGKIVDNRTFLRQYQKTTGGKIRNQKEFSWDEVSGLLHFVMTEWSM